MAPAAPAAAAAAATAAAPATAATAAPAATAPAATTFTVADAKRLIIETYPKLYSRFNYAFHGHEDAAPLVGVVDAIKSDVRTWLQSMPDNFKTSNHALSRPKYGLLFVLKTDEARAALGDDYCGPAVDAIERAWDECKKDVVVSKEDVPLLESEEELRAKIDDLAAKNEIMSTALISLLSKHYDADISALFETLLSKI